MKLSIGAGSQPVVFLWLQKGVIILAASSTLAACSPDESGANRLGINTIETDVPGAIKLMRLPAYPEAKRTDHVDIYHDVEVEDPYRWMEDMDAPALQAWIEAENALTEKWLQQLPLRDYFRSSLKKLINYERFGIPHARGGVYAYTHNPGLLEQDILFVTDDPAQKGVVLLDPNGLSPDGTIALAGYRLSPDGKWLAYSLSDGGSDWDTWRIRSTTTHVDLDEILSDTKFTSAAWTEDSAGFFYSRYPQDEFGNGDDSAQVSVWYHRLGTEQADDAEIYRITDHDERNPYGSVTDDGRYLVISETLGWKTNGIRYIELEANKPGGPPKSLLQDWDALYTFVGNRGTEFFFYTTNAAANGRVIALDINAPQPEHWREVVAATNDAIDAVTLVGGMLIVSYIHDAHARALRYSLEGEFIDEINLPGIGSVYGFAGRDAATETFFAYTDFTHPLRVFRYDLQAGTAVPLHADAPDTEAAPESANVLAKKSGNAPETDSRFNPDRFVQSQIFFSSKDGTRIPMFIIRPKGSELNGELPLALYGYGGFKQSLLPQYSTARMAWLEAGGALAIANLRGGGEYGTEWHDAGRVLNKQNVFDDFIAAAEWLIENKYTSPEYLGIWGGSNGGLLVAAVANQRPDLFSVVVPAVGVLDMLRYQTASANARHWSSDYGLSENADEFQVLRAYSPYHNIKPDTCYPATLVMADANDDRVVPWHSYKYAAALQYAQKNTQGCSNPILLRTETRTGHAGMVTSKFINEYADQWAMVADRLGLKIGE
jgi:prolyl oligopeptidase